jgi:hypothetical protein
MPIGDGIERARVDRFFDHDKNCPLFSAGNFFWPQGGITIFVNMKKMTLDILSIMVAKGWCHYISGLFPSNPLSG